MDQKLSSGKVVEATEVMYHPTVPDYLSSEGAPCSMEQSAPDCTAKSAVTPENLSPQSHDEAKTLAISSGDSQAMSKQGAQNKNIVMEPVQTNLNEQCSILNETTPNAVESVSPGSFDQRSPIPVIVLGSGDVKSEGSQEEMVPLLTVDDTESQSSDVISYDTVSYDIIHQQGEDDDEKSVGTMSSASYDIRLDSPQMLSHASNASSTANLLDFSAKETSVTGTSSSAQVAVSGPSSSASSCVSSPSHKTVSSAVDGSLSEAMDCVFGVTHTPCNSTVPLSTVPLVISEVHLMADHVNVSNESPLGELSVDELISSPVRECSEEQNIPLSNGTATSVLILKEDLMLCEPETTQSELVDVGQLALDEINEITIANREPTSEPAESPMETSTLTTNLQDTLTPTENSCDTSEQNAIVCSGVTSMDEEESSDKHLNPEQLTSPVPSAYEVPQDTTDNLSSHSQNVTEISGGASKSDLKLPEDSHSESISEPSTCVLDKVNENEKCIGATGSEKLSPHTDIIALETSLESLQLECRTHPLPDTTIKSISEAPLLSASPVEEVLGFSIEEISVESTASVSLNTSHDLELELVQELTPDSTDTSESSIPSTLVARGINENGLQSCSGPVEIGEQIHISGAKPSAPACDFQDNALEPSTPNPHPQDSASGNFILSQVQGDPIEISSQSCQSPGTSISQETSSSTPQLNVIDLVETSDLLLQPQDSDVDSSALIVDTTNETTPSDLIDQSQSESSVMSECSTLSTPSAADGIVGDLEKACENLINELLPPCCEEIKPPNPEEDVRSIPAGPILDPVRQPSHLDQEPFPKEVGKTLPTSPEKSDLTAERLSQISRAASNHSWDHSDEEVSKASSDITNLPCESVLTTVSCGESTLIDVDSTKEVAKLLVDQILDLAVEKVRVSKSEIFLTKKLQATNAAGELVDEVLEKAVLEVNSSGKQKSKLTEGSNHMTHSANIDNAVLSVSTAEEHNNDAFQPTPTSDLEECLDTTAGLQREVNFDDKRIVGSSAENCNNSIESSFKSAAIKMDDTATEVGGEADVGINVEPVSGVVEESEVPEFEHHSGSSSDISLAQDRPDIVLQSNEGDSSTSDSSGIEVSGGKLSDHDELKEEDLLFLRSKSTSPECITALDSARSSRSSLHTATEIAVQREASVFVDGVIQSAVQQYEESSSSESSPLKRIKPKLTVEFPEPEDEELATPCGEMLTEHFMDFESGRNVSVFCSVPEDKCHMSGERLSPYDRVVNTIGTCEVDSDTGKSVSLFRSEDEVYYEIQRASTCTSVFESVEEEDEDMIDTTVPLEDRQADEELMMVKEKDSLAGSPLQNDCDAFEDAVDAFLEKSRVARTETKMTSSSNDNVEMNKEAEDLDLSLVPVVRRRRGSVSSGVIEDVPSKYVTTVSRRHPEVDLSDAEEKRRMAERWANGGESEVPDTPEMREKQLAIRLALDSGVDVAAKLCKLALTEGGLINDALRREAWPRMLGLDPTIEIPAPPLEELKSHPEYGQVVLDVNRSLKRFPPDIPPEQRETLQDKLTRLIMYVISKYPHLRYYQGYHDVAVTFLLVVGEAVAFQIMERLSIENLADCMQPTMERTSYLLHFIYPLLHRLHPTLAEYLERSEVGTMFCLPWFLTWFGHSLNRYQDVVRLYDHFLASPPLAPLYLAAVLVAHRADEVLAVDCDMASIHSLLSHIPDTLPLEILLRDATDLYQRYPPESIEKEVEERFKNEQELRINEMEARTRIRQQRALQRHGRQDSGTWQMMELQQRFGPAMMVFNRWMPPWMVQQQRLSMRLLFASATFFVGFYVYARGGDVFPYP